MSAAPVVPEQFTARLVRELKGAPLACFILLLLSDSPISNEWLCRMSGYTDKPVAQAMKLLSGPEYKIARRSRGGWILSHTFQFVTGKDESRNISVPTTTTVLINNISTEEVVVASRKNSDLEERFDANIAACKSFGIGEPSASKLSDMEHVTPDFIRGHVTGLKKGETLGLAILRIQNNEAIFVPDVKSETDASPLDRKIELLRQRKNVAVETDVE